MKFQNVEGSSEKYGDSRSWIKYYKSQTNQLNTIRSLPCSERDCKNKGTDGAHVFIKTDTQTRPPKDVYLIPLCSVHNHPTNVGWCLLKENVRKIEAPPSQSKC